MNGFLLADKPEGISTFDVVRMVRRRLPSGVKVGHGGTLDPFASGLVLVLVGKATRLMPWVVGHDKRYLLTVRLGGTSDTDDRTGLVERSGLPMPLTADVDLAVRTVSRMTEQVPPAVSALHVDGERAYRRVRRGEAPDLPARPVHYHEVRVVRYNANEPGGGLVELDVTCGSGTYMRAFARDLGHELRVGGMAEQLRRLSVGPWNVEDAFAPEELAEGLLMPMGRLLPGMAQVPLDQHEARSFANGQEVTVDLVRVPPALEPGSELAVTDEDANLIGVCRLAPIEDRTVRRLRPHVVLAEASVRSTEEIS